jgi:hypothetical protein
MALFSWGKSSQKAKGRGSLSLTEARLERGEVLLGDLHELKTSISEARYENDFNNAKATFLRQEFEVVAAHLEEIKETYAGAQSWTLGRDLKAKGLSRQEARDLAAKQAAIRNVLKRFDELIAALHLRAAKEAGQQFGPRKSQGDTSAHGLPEGFAKEFAAAADVVAQAEVVERHFTALSVNTTDDAKPATFYAYRKGDTVTPLITADRFPTSSLIPISHAVSGKSLKPLTIKAFLTLGKNQELVQLQPRRRNGVSPKEQPAETNEDATQRFTSLDLTDFNQLVLAADQSGLIPSIPISNARDQYYRQEHYQHAFGAIERAYQDFITKAAQRMTRLRQEEEAYKRGRLKMSPKKWQEKQRQDAAQTQRIERTRKHFKLVLDGLRLLHLRQLQAKGKVS